ncbi:AraC family transcriptional regulator [soil metagenome]
MPIEFERSTGNCRVATPLRTDAGAAPAVTPPAAGMPSLMWLNADRVLYAGLLGEPSTRAFGSYSVYASLTVPHRISLEGGAWQATELSVVPPNVPHRIASAERMICSQMIEAETVAPAELPAWLRDSRGAVETADAQAVRRRMHGALEAFRHSGRKEYANAREFDIAFFGEALAPRPLDKRIAAVLQRIKLDPNQPHSAQECAAAACVSVSRFLHLFKAEVGTPFRSFRTWQRARSLLYYVTQTTSLAHIALDAGYPDSTHFSHSIRQVYGLTPKSIFAGCRKLALYGDAIGAVTVPSGLRSRA